MDSIPRSLVHAFRLVTLTLAAGIAASGLAQTTTRPIPTQPKPTRPAPGALAPQTASKIPATAARSPAKPVNHQHEWESPVHMHGGYESFGAPYGDHCGDVCCQPECLPIYGSIEALLWWTNGDRAPALVTTSPLGTPEGQAGRRVPGDPTTVLFGNESLGNEIRPGLRVMLGASLNPCFQIEFSYFDLFTQNDSFATDSTVHPIIARPFLNVSRGVEDTEQVAFRGGNPRESLITGGINVEHDSRLYGAGVLARRTVMQVENGCYNSRLQLLGGYRHLQFNESLSIRTERTVVRPAVGSLIVPGTQFSVTDSFAAQNSFHGADLGLSALFGTQCCSLEMFGRVAIGNSRETVRVRGQSQAVVPTGVPPTDVPGPVRASGLLAQGTNTGTFIRDDFDFVPEIGATLRWSWGSGWQCSLGYNFLYWNQVARAAEQVDLAINTSTFAGLPLVGAARPEPPIQQGHLWAQGINLGLEYRY